MDPEIKINYYGNRFDEWTFADIHFVDGKITSIRFWAHQEDIDDTRMENGEGHVVIFRKDIEP